MSKWWNAKYAQICSHEETNASTSLMAWSGVRFWQIIIFGWSAPLKKKKLFYHNYWNINTAHAYKSTEHYPQCKQLHPLESKVCQKKEINKLNTENAEFLQSHHVEAVLLEGGAEDGGVRIRALQRWVVRGLHLNGWCGMHGLGYSLKQTQLHHTDVLLFAQDPHTPLQPKQFRHSVK